MFRLFFCAIGLAALTACGSVAPTQTSSSSSASSSATPSEINKSFGTLLNNTRAANGAGSVTFDSRLAKAAQRHADDLNDNDLALSHTGSDGSNVGDRVTDAGYNWSNVAENVAQGQADVNEAMDGWTNSPGHHANNINPVFEDFALAKAGSGSKRRWVLVLAKEQ